MRNKRQLEGLILAGQVLQQVEEEERETVWLDRVSGDLETRGVPRERAESIALQLCEGRHLDEMSPEQYESLLDGASTACEVEEEDESSPTQDIGEVREIERMMQAFAGELAKLDESLEVLSAYVRRMREQPAPKPRRIGNKTLH